MKRRPVTQDSFDLFLDTICNTFGGIIFLAILVAILVQTRTISHSSEQRNPTTYSHQETRQFIKHLSVAEANVQSLNLSLQNLPELEASEDVRTLIQKQSELVLLQQQISAAVDEQAKKTDTLKQLIEENASLQHENKKIPERLNSLSMQLEAEQAAVADLIDARKTTLRLPRETETRSDSTLALLKGRLIFLAGQFDNGANAFDGPGVTTSKLLLSYKVSPVIDRGMNIADADVDSFIATTGKNNQIVTLAVWPDSFANFASLREKFIASGVRYQIWIQDPESDLLITIGNSTSSRAQ